jgi:hypothetical protein
LIPNYPNFFIIGAAKSGTTRLHYLLGLHPEVFTSKPKELFFFNKPAPDQNEFEDYIKIFQDIGTAKAIGESSTSYTNCWLNPGTARRIFEFNREARLIYIVRHPLRRIESSWIQSRSTAIPIPADFCEAVRLESTNILSRTLYWTQLSEYRRYFPDDQILLLFFEEFIQDEASTLRRCFEFLKVNPHAVVDCASKERQNSFVGKKQAHPILDWLDSQRSVPLRLLRARLSGRQKLRLRSKLLVRPILSRPKWDEGTWQWAVERLRPDIERFLNHAGKPIDFWSWELEPDAKI